MDAPPVQYVRTSDGYDIAYGVSGSGRALVFMPPALHHVQLSWSPQAITTPLLGALASRYRLVQFDGRGQGLSTRNLPETTSMDDLLRDLVAVMDRLAPEPAVIIGHGATSHVAVNYVLEHPERVAALIFMSCSVANSAWPAALWRDLARERWESFILSASGISASPLLDTRAALERYRQFFTQSDWLIREHAYRDSDLSHVLHRLSLPALVLHPRAYFGLPGAEPMKLASLIGGAHYIEIEGQTPYGDTEQAVAAIDWFIDQLPAGKQAAPPPNDNERHRLTAREAEVLRLIAAGRSNQQIADALVLSLRTVERHITNLYGKIGAHGKADATAYALRHGLE